MPANKLEKLILYIAQQSHDDPHFGATKLNKILFFADFLAYGYLGHSITGATYVHRDYGPVPQELLAAQNALLESGRAALMERTVFGYTQKRLISLVSVNTSVFSPEELQIIDQTLAKLEPMNATELSEFTHNFRPWRDTLDGEPIPYFTVFVMDDLPVTRSDREWAMSIIAGIEAEENRV